MIKVKLGLQNHWRILRDPANTKHLYNICTMLCQRRGVRPTLGGGGGGSGAIGLQQGPLWMTKSLHRHGRAGKLNGDILFHADLY